MGLSQTLLLGFIAGVTILFGLPMGRWATPAPSLRVMLNGAAVGVLVFLVWDVLSAAWQPIDEALAAIRGGEDGLASALGYGALFTAGLTVGLVSLVWYERWMSARVRAMTPRFGPGAATVGEVASGHRGGWRSWSGPRRLALLIATGIGLHNFAEGLAIGQSAAAGDIALATVLIVGFGLHNATEGFGIVAPLPGDEQGRPSWAFLGLLGLIGGGPTFLGAGLGHGFSSEPLNVVFLTLAAGSILYVVIQLITVAAKAKRQDLLAYGLLVGVIAGFLTDAIITAGGI
jgi:ZIP family zinc transporter